MVLGRNRPASPDSVLAAAIDHPFLKTQLVYDARPEIAMTPAYTRVLWDRQHRWIGADLARFKPVEKVRLLDVGCGPGHIADSQARHIGVYVGIDPSLIELRRARKRPERQFIHGIGEQLGFVPDHSFDVVTLISVLDHCIDWKLTLGHCARVLRPGGAMLILMENSEQLPSRIRRWLGRGVEHYDHMHFLSLGDIEAALGDGFAVLKTRTFGYGFGLHRLTAHVSLPRRLIDAVAMVMDGVGRLVMPNCGQALYGWYRKKPNDAAAISDDMPLGEATLSAGIWEMLPP